MLKNGHVKQEIAQVCSDRFVRVVFIDWVLGVNNQNEMIEYAIFGVDTFVPPWRWEILSGFFDNNGLTPIFIDCNGTSGSLDEDTGLWNGAVAMVNLLYFLFLIIIFRFRTMRQILVLEALDAVMLEVLLLHALLQLILSLNAGFLKLLEDFHQQQILLESSLMMFGCLSFSVWSFLVSFYLLLQRLEHIMEILLNLMKIFWFLLGKQFSIEIS